MYLDQASIWIWLADNKLLGLQNSTRENVLPYRWVRPDSPTDLLVLDAESLWLLILEANP